MDVTHEALLKGLIKQMVSDRCTEEDKLLLFKLSSREINVNDLTNHQKNIFRLLVHRVKNDIVGYVESMSRGSINTNWEIII
jgi:hypothetical protein